MAYTYSKIATVTVGSGGVSSIDFLAIPQNYTDLVLKVSGRSSGSNNYDNLWINFNGDTSNSYAERNLYGLGTGTPSSTNASSVAQSSKQYMNFASSTANTFGNLEFYIPNYTSGYYKSFSTDGVTENNAIDALAGFNAGLWSKSAPIVSIKLTPNSGNFVQYSSATLYGIKAEL